MKKNKKGNFEEKDCL